MNTLRGETRKGKRQPLWPWAVGALAVLWLIGTLAGGGGGGAGVRAGVRAVVGPGHGAWFAADGEAFDLMVDAQNADNPRAYGPLITAGRMFREPAGSGVDVLRTDWTGGAFVRVVAGANAGASGWTQVENLARAD